MLPTSASVSSAAAHSMSNHQISRTDVLVIAGWWGLLAGLLEGWNWRWHHSPVWHDLMRAAVVTDVVLFLGLGVLIIVSNRRPFFKRNLLTRATIAFAFLALYYSWAGLLPHLVIGMASLSSLAAGLLIGCAFYFYDERAVRFLKRSIFVLLIFAVWYVVVFPLQERREEQRQIAQLTPPTSGTHNVVVILIDTLRADHLSTYGYTRPTSPNLSGIADQGVLFENAIAPSAWTIPSHASILTGLYPHDHHAGDSAHPNLDPQYFTLAEALKMRGYRTAAFSANGRFFSRSRGFGRGFIHFEDAFRTWRGSFGQTMFGAQIDSWIEALHLEHNIPGRLSAQVINRNALHWIGSGHAPFFVVLNYLDVHEPYLPPEPYLHYYTKAKHRRQWYSDDWQSSENLTPQELQTNIDSYDGAINYVDDQIAKLMQELKKRGLGEHTLVIITSDHGEGFNEHGLVDHGNSLYRELIHVPLIFWEPGEIPVGRRVPEPVSLTALPATVLDLLGYPTHRVFGGSSVQQAWTETGSGISIAPALSELAQLPWNRKYPNYYGPMQSITTSEWHYITGGNRGEQLFHWSVDATEARNLATAPGGKKLCGQLRQDLEALQAMDIERTPMQHPVAVSHTLRYSNHPCGPFANCDASSEIRSTNAHQN